MTGHEERRTELMEEFGDDPAAFFRRFFNAMRQTTGSRPRATWAGAMIDFIMDVEELGQIDGEGDSRTPNEGLEVVVRSDRLAGC